MSEEEMLEQLYSLIEDRNSFILEDKLNDCEIFKKDKMALETVIDKNKELKSRLDNAIEYIVNRQKASGQFSILENELLEVLKGESNE